MIPWHCTSQFLPFVPLTPELCEKEQLLCVTPASGPQQKFAGKLIGHNQERKAYIFFSYWRFGEGGCLCFKHIQDLQTYVIALEGQKYGREFSV